LHVELGGCNCTDNAQSHHSEQFHMRDMQVGERHVNRGA